MSKESARYHGHEQRGARPTKLARPVSLLRDIQINDATSRNGRPVFEVNATPETLERTRKRGIPMEEMEAPYPDSRKGYPYNKSALQEIGLHFQDFLDNLAWINNEYFEGTVPDSVTAHDVVRMSEIASAMPSYVINRGHRPFQRHGQLPDSLADMHKIGAGVRMAAEGLCFKREQEGISPQERLLPDQLYQYADDSGLFLSNTSEQACAAPPRLMFQTFDALFYQKGAEASNSSAAKMIDDFSSLSEFSGFYTQSIKKLGGLAGKVEKIQDIYFVLDGAPIPSSHVGTFIQLLVKYKEAELKFTKAMTPLQENINRTLGREYKNIRPVTQSEVSQAIGLDPYRVGIEIGIPQDIVTAIKKRPPLTIVIPASRIKL